MIGRNFIEEWREQRPWKDAQVEQDLVGNFFR